MTSYDINSVSVGRLLPKFVTPADVRDLKVRVDAFVRATDQTVTTCASIPQGIRAAWTDFANAWRAYFAEEDSWWHTAAQMDQGEAYERDLGAWQTTLAPFHCTGAPPIITPSNGGGDVGGNVDRWQGTLKTVAIAGAVVAVALGVRAVVR